MKKLWQRSKGKIRSSHDERSGPSSTSKTRTKISAVPRNVPAVPPVPDRAANRVSGPDATPHPGSSSRMQPTLVGISKSSATSTRPGTAGSLQNAIDQAANKVVQTPSSDFFKGHTRTKSPRSVDIFATQNPRRSKASYNEDVASRNIDVKKVAEDATEHPYIPSSKYQEEVASRNAHGHTTSLGETSYENLPPRPDAPRSNTIGSSYHMPPDQPGDGKDIRRLHQAQLASLRQPRPGSGPKDVPRLGSAQQADAQTAQATKSTMPLLLSRPSQDARRNYETMQSANISPIPRESSERGRKARQEPLQPLSTTNLNIIAAISSLPGYQLSQSELLQQDTDSHPPSEPVTSRRPGYTVRSMSNVSTASSTRKSINLQNRTIMDLTGEDYEIFFNGHLESNSNDSPVVGQAHVDSFRRVYAEIVTLGGQGYQRNENATLPSHNTGQATSLPNSIPSTSRTPAKIQQPISFSTINTVASFSPSKHGNGEAHASTEKVMSSPSKVGARGTSTKLYTLSETEPETEDFATPLAEPSGFLSRFPSLAKGNLRGTSFIQDGVATGLPSSPPSVEKPRLSETAESTSQHIQMSPESLQSRDFIEPSRAFGVLARDFAVTPTKPIHISRSDQAPNTKAKVQHRVPLANGEAVRPIENPITKGTDDGSSSTFDEERFRLRKEEARAALIKLQESLNEDFVPPLRTARPPLNSSRNRAVSSSPSASSSGRSTYPATTFSQVEDFQAIQPQIQSEIQPRTSSHKPQISAQDGPSSSTRPESAASTATVRPLRQQRSASAQSGGRNRDLDSALNDMRRLAEEMRNPKLAFPPLPQPPVQKQNTTNINRFSSSTNSTNSSDVVPSPGELSLSSFPAPASVVHSRHQSLNLPIQNPADTGLPDSNSNSAQAHLEQVAEANDENEAPAPTVPYYYGNVTTPPPKTHVSRLQQESQHQKLPQASTSAPRLVLQSPQPGERKTLSRRGSAQSQASSTASQFSIPYHLIPERGSSMRDSLVREVDDEL